MKKLEYPLMAYVDDDFRENFFKSKNPEKKYAFDERDYLVEVKEDFSQLGAEDMLKLRKMLDEVKPKKMSAQEIIEWATGGQNGNK